MNYNDPGPPPPVGRYRDFDNHVQEFFGNVDTSTEEGREQRRAAWATWKTKGPSAPPTRQVSTEDDDLAKALALSVKYQTSGATDDDDMARAIAMSLEPQGSSSRPIAIDDDDDDNGGDDDEFEIVMALSAKEAEAARLAKEAGRRAATPDDERAEIAKAMAASMEEQKAAMKLDDSSDLEVEEMEEPPKKRVKTDVKLASPKEGPSSLTTGSALSSLGFDRAQMERERLARQAQRSGQVAPAIPPPSTSAPPPSTSRASTPSSGHPLQSKGPFPRDAAGEYFLDGELRHVALRFGSQSTEKTFDPRSVFGDPSQVSLIIVSSFVYDFDWLATVLPNPALVPTVRVIRPQTNDYAQKRALQGKLQPMPDGAIHVYPDMGGKAGGSEHMKYAWIFYKTGRLRVAIMTANLVPYDYEDIENTIFVQDFLPKGRTLTSESSGSSSSPLPDFPDQFRRLFSHLKVYKALRKHIAEHPGGKSLPISADQSFDDFGKYDWSRVRVRLVMSIPGAYRGFESMAESGICRLGKIVEDEGWKPQKGERAVAEYQGSSLGGYSLDFYQRFYQCLCGMDLRTMKRQPKARSWAPIKVIFPTLATVDASVLGRPGGGTMFCGQSFDKAPHLFHDANSKRGGVLMHTKMIIVTFEEEESSSSPFKTGKRKVEELDGVENAVGGWVYVGSHNFSPSAWGTINFQNTPETLNISNYELGIMFPLPRANASAVADKIAAHKRPPRPYAKNDEPWSQKKHMS